MAISYLLSDEDEFLLTEDGERLLLEESSDPIIAATWVPEGEPLAT